MLAPRQLDPGRPIERCQDLVLVFQELHEQVPVELDVLDNQDSSSRPRFRFGLSNRRQGAPHLPQQRVTLQSPLLDHGERASLERALSSGVSSLAVRTITGMSRRSELPALLEYGETVEPWHRQVRERSRPAAARL